MLAIIAQYGGRRPEKGMAMRTRKIASAGHGGDTLAARFDRFDGKPKAVALCGSTIQADGYRRPLPGAPRAGKHSHGRNRACGWLIPLFHVETGC